MLVVQQFISGTQTFFRSRAASAYKDHSILYKSFIHQTDGSTEREIDRVKSNKHTHTKYTKNNT